MDRGSTQVTVRLPIATLFLYLCLGAPSALPIPQNTQAAEPIASALTNKDILDMVGAGLTAEVVIAKMKLSKCNFDTSPDALKALKAANVPDAVILAMVQAPVDSGAASVVAGSLKTASITCINAKEIPAYPTPDVSSAVTNARCGSKVSVLDHQGTWVKIQTEDGKTGWVSQYFVSTESQRISTFSEKPASVSPTPSRATNLPPNMVRAIGYRVIPQQRTTYYQSGSNSSSTSCYGQGQFSSFGNYGNMNMNMNCDTTYSTPTQIPVTWQFADVYIVVQGSTEVYLIGCRANWRWSKCTPLIVGEVFPVEISGGTMKVTGTKNGKKEVQVKYNILQVSPTS